VVVDDVDEVDVSVAFGGGVEVTPEADVDVMADVEDGVEVESAPTTAAVLVEPVARAAVEPLMASPSPALSEVSGLSGSPRASGSPPRHPAAPTSTRVIASAEIHGRDAIGVSCPHARGTSLSLDRFRACSPSMLSYQTFRELT